MAREYDCYIRHLHEDIENKEGQATELLIRDYDNYVFHPVIAKVHRTWSQNQDKLYIRDPLGKPYKKDPWGLEIVKEEDEEKILDPAFHKCGL